MISCLDLGCYVFMLEASMEADTVSYYKPYCSVTVTRMRDIYSTHIPQDKWL